MEKLLRKSFSRATGRLVPFPCGCDVSTMREETRKSSSTPTGNRRRTAHRSSPLCDSGASTAVQSNWLHDALQVRAPTLSRKRASVRPVPIPLFVVHCEPNTPGPS